MLVPFNTLPDTARIWIFQANRLLTDEECTSLQQRTDMFVTDWTAHNNVLQASCIILHNVFLIIGVDENANSASGCSIDKAFRHVAQCGEVLQINFFDRMNVAIPGKDITFMHYHQLQKAKALQSMKFYNNTILTKGDLTTHWLQLA